MMAGIILMAAGRGMRFIQAGGKNNKLNAFLNTQTLFSATLTQALASGLPVHVVTRPDNHEVQQTCHQQQVPYTLLESQGLGDSIATGVAAASGWSGWLIHLADMPFVPVSLFSQIVQALQTHEIVRPFHQQIPGHPVGFSQQLRPALLALKGDEGARSLLTRRTVFRLTAESVGVIQDIDLPSQLPAGEN